MVKVGDTIYRFDSNRRTYPPPEPGEKYSHKGPIFEKHFEPWLIVGDDKRSWLIERIEERPLPLNGLKDRLGKTMVGKGVWSTEEQKTAKVWNNEHKYKVIRALEYGPPEMVRKVAELIGYKEAP